MRRYREHIDEVGCCGAAELLKLYAYQLVHSQPQLPPVQEREQLCFFRIRYLGILRISERIPEIFGFGASLHFDHISVNMTSFETFDTGLEILRIPRYLILKKLSCSRS